MCSKDNCSRSSFTTTPTTSIPVAELQALHDKIKDLEGDKERLSDMAVFMCGLWSETDKLRYKTLSLPDTQIKDYLFGKWPVVQGTRNQINLTSIGEKPYDSANIAKAVKMLLMEARK
jgi:hypothetical protein